MRGFDQRHDGFFTYVRLESRVPKTHPQRVIRTLADQAPAFLDDRFAGLSDTAKMRDSGPGDRNSTSSYRIFGLEEAFSTAC